jgi:hypothetical protein
MGLEKVHHTYARLLSQHSLGHALYHPVTADNLRPGSIGFFDDNGHWCSLANYPGVIPVDLGVPNPGQLGKRLLASRKLGDLKVNVGVSVE